MIAHSQNKIRSSRDFGQTHNLERATPTSPSRGQLLGVQVRVSFSSAERTLYESETQLVTSPIEKNIPWQVWINVIKCLPYD